jgi:hypothetical protein
MGQETSDSDGDKKLVFPLEQKQIEELKGHMDEELYNNLSLSVGSGWKLR